jgi:hypothetical protein
MLENGTNNVLIMVRDHHLCYSDFNFQQYLFSKTIWMLEILGNKGFGTLRVKIHTVIICSCMNELVQNHINV